MKVRWCKAVDQLTECGAAAAVGFDAVESDITGLMALSDGGFQDVCHSVKASGVSVEVFNSPLPGRVRVTEDGFNIYVWGEYLKRAVDRVSELGCRAIVWNDGKARLLPVEGSVENARRQALQFLYMLSDYARSYDITVLVEPLDERRTNFLTSMAEVAEFLALEGRPNTAAAISLRDLDAIGFDESAFVRYAGLVSHVYLEFPGAPAGPRVAPHAQDGCDYQSFFRSLSAIDYAGLITLPSGADESSLSFCRAFLSV